ncbi:MAG: cobalt-precorrin-5B (C(1))-methyltransferase CbiD [Ruminococcus sp.]|nr:cobalt-precorrin-5B (C(1))-methyltransferase CbiD [Ruminococcus sp.]
MNERYIYSGTKKLRCGYTTGSCAAAAAKACAQMLLGGRQVNTVRLVTPSGTTLEPGVTDQYFSPNEARCSIVKDSGDDPDVTNGIKIFAELTLSENGVEIIGGEGIGTVTKPGLDQPVGAAAINSVPRKMITEALEDVARAYDYHGGFRVTISAPAGKELAAKTFNPRMGIVGGISIIGTTGIIEPMSNSAVIETIRTEANMRKAAGNQYLLLTVGNYSEELVKLKAGELSARTVMCSNFIGEALDIGVSLGFNGILLIGHIGKLVKLGSGIMNTHSAYADGRMETLMACGVLAGIDSKVLARLPECATVDAALDILYEANCAEPLLSALSERIAYYIDARVKGEVVTGAFSFSKKHGMLFKTEHADELLKYISEE